MNFFDRSANFIARMMGHPGAFIIAGLTIVVWAVIGPLAGYSDTWQLIINTSTTIVTFLMVFLIQTTQNRDSNAMQLKLDELLRALDTADTRLCDLEERSETELQRLHAHYVGLANDAGPDSADRSEPPAGGQARPRRGRRNQSPRAGVEEPQT